nr:hypothetical protein [Tanacetum cinerariifolium]
MEGKICPIIKTSPVTILPSGNRLHIIRIPTVAPNEETRRRYSIAKNLLIRAHINIYGYPFNPPKFAFIRNSAIPEESSWNFKFLAIMGYGDLQMGNILILRVYYVKGLSHNLFFVGQFCDSDFEVAFRKHTCFVRNLEDVKFLRTKDKALEIIIKILKQAQVSLNSTVRYLRIDNGIKFLNQTLQNYTEEAEVVATACYTQNHSLVHTRYNKTPYELLKDRKTELKYLHVFGALCYQTKDFQDLGKLQPKADIGIFIGYSPSKKAYRIYNKRTRQIMETMNLQFDELTQMVSEQHGSRPELQGLTSGHISLGLVLNQAASTSTKPLTKNDWDSLFQPMFDEYFKSPSTISTPILVVALLLPDTATTSSSSNN